MAPMRISPCITHLIMNIFVVPLNMEDILSVYADVFQIIIPCHNPFLSKNLFIKTTLCLECFSSLPLHCIMIAK